MAGRTLAIAVAVAGLGMAGIGAAIGGPRGAAIGSIAGHDSDHGHRARYVSETISVAPQARYVPAARYAGDGSSADCEPRRPLREVVAAPVKNVCRQVGGR